MYKAIVRRQLRKTFAALGRGDYEAVVAKFGDDGVFCMAGEQHGLAGENRGPNEVRAWFERAYRLFPDLRLEPDTITVNGPPWNTVVGTRFFVSATLPDGSPYRNEGMQFLRLRWAKVVEDRLYEDTQALAEAIEAVAEHGAKSPA